MEIDAAKLRNIILELVIDTQGACSRSVVCIGEVGGRQILLTVEADREEFIDEILRWNCIQK